MSTPITFLWAFKVTRFTFKYFGVKWRFFHSIYSIFIVYILHLNHFYKILEFTVIFFENNYILQDNFYAEMLHVSLYFGVKLVLYCSKCYISSKYILFNVGFIINHSNKYIGWIWWRKISVFCSIILEQCFTPKN